MGNASIARALLASGVLSCAGCHGEGDGADSAAAPAPVEVGLAFEFAGVWLNEGDAPASLAVVLSTSLPALARDVSVEVVDLGTGTARSGADHVAFPPRRVTFAAGSVDGATAVVQLDPLDDEFVEAQGETVELGLRRAIGGELAGTTRLTVTLIDADRARVGFVSAAGTASEGSAGHVALELECGAGVTLQVDVTALVSDLGLGTAVAGDYAAFPAETFLFAAGTSDGAVRTTSLALLDDSAPEVDETIALGLSSSWPAEPGAIPVHVLTIEDDDLAGNATFLASEGSRGIENELVHDELVDLGRNAVGGGPGEGTEVRVGNLGGLPMALGPPELFGTHANDFSIVVESSSFAVPSAHRPARAGPAVAEACAPLTAQAGDAGPGVLLRLEAAELARMSRLSNVSLQGVALHGLVLPELGPVTLELARRPLPVAPDARLVIDGREVAGGPRTLLGDLQLWSGSVAGLEGSRVFLAFDREGVQGFVRTSGPSGGLVHVFSDGPGRVRFVGEAELRSLGARLPDAFCVGERFRPGAAPLAAVPSEPGGPSTSALTVTNCRLAIETDHPLFETLGSSSVELTEYVVSLIAAVGETFATEVQTTLSIAYLGIHTTTDDGWDSQDTEGASALDLFYEFQEAWGPNFLWPAEADLAHFLSSARLGGGVGYLGVLCDPDYGFAVSANLHGRIDWSAWTGQAAAFTWDFVVVAHELGHNFGSLHTHSYCPPLDECAPIAYWEGCQDETRCERGTIMSYCHLGCGGMANIDLTFHPVTANYMRSDVNACLEPAALSPGDYVQYRLRFDPLTATGLRTTTLLFTHDALNARQPFRVRLSGTAE